MIVFEQNKNGNYVAKLENDGKKRTLFSDVEFLNFKEDNLKGYFTAQVAIFDEEKNKYVAGGYYLLSPTGKKLCEFSKNCNYPDVRSFISSVVFNKSTKDFISNLKNIKDSYFLADKKVEKYILENREKIWCVMMNSFGEQIGTVMEEFVRERNEIKKIFNVTRNRNKLNQIKNKNNSIDGNMSK